MEKQVAEKAMEYIRDEMTIALGSGKSIEYLLEFISMKNFKDLKIVTTTLDMAIKANQKGLNVIPCSLVDHIDYAFEEVDYVFNNLQGLKTQLVEDNFMQLLTSMTDHVILIVQKNHFNTLLTNGYPVQVGVLKQAYSYASKELAQLGAIVSSTQKGMLQSGGYKLEIKFTAVKDLKDLNNQINAIPGVISTSIFIHEHPIVIVYNDHQLEILTK